jgi:hypothetical protein
MPERHLPLESHPAKRVSKSTHPIRRWVTLLLGLVVLILLLSALLLARENIFATPRDPDLTLTVKPVYGPSAISSYAPMRMFRQEVALPVLGKLLVLFERLRGHPEATFLFPATPAKSFSIYALLNQCMQITGRRYFIEKTVAEGTILFGTTNDLDGPLWVKNFEHALESSEPKWIHHPNEQPTRKGLVLLQFNKRTILVLSPEAAKKYGTKYPRHNVDSD